ncbi:uncharacterized protein LOC131856834 [Cryptomeria japonica]|uniref:uncharacterized protein LOC131856834 n=1 Tax=Cryptomeria japonica TaxID=3369 RepID=UPI0027DA655F|nr:uncharacterized protein LOC131856834 [Cryptomeria japonica]
MKGESASTSMQPVISLFPPTSISVPEIPFLERVVPHAPSSKGAGVKPAPAPRPPCPPRTTQPPVVSTIPMGTPNATMRKAPMLSKPTTRPPFELPIMVDIHRPSRYAKGKRLSWAPSSLLAPTS